MISQNSPLKSGLFLFEKVKDDSRNDRREEDRNTSIRIKRKPVFIFYLPELVSSYPVIFDRVYAKFAFTTGGDTIFFDRVAGDIPKMKILTRDGKFNSTQFAAVGTLERVGVM